MGDTCMHYSEVHTRNNKIYRNYVKCSKAPSSTNSEKDMQAFRSIKLVQIIKSFITAKQPKVMKTDTQILQLLEVAQEDILLKNNLQKINHDNN